MLKYLQPVVAGTIPALNRLFKDCQMEAIKRLIFVSFFVYVSILFIRAIYQEAEFIMKIQEKSSKCIASNDINLICQRTEQAYLSSVHNRIT